MIQRARVTVTASFRHVSKECNVKRRGQSFLISKVSSLSWLFLVNESSVFRAENRFYKTWKNFMDKRRPIKEQRSLPVHPYIYALLINFHLDRVRFEISHIGINEYISILLFLFRQLFYIEVHKIYSALYIRWNNYYVSWLNFNHALKLYSVKN